MRAIIIASGDIEDERWLKNYIQPGDVVICADGGYNHLVQIGCMPDVIIGDMDSIREKYRADCQHLVHPRKKDETDAQLALDYAIENGFHDIKFLGALGGSRIEHALANVFMLQYAAVHGVEMAIETPVSTITLHRGTTTAILQGRKGDYLSLIPIGGDATGITTQNLEYPLHEGTLYFGVPMGISNILLEDTCSIELQKGILLAILTKADEVDEG